MKLDLQTMIGTVLEIGANTPAYKALFDQVIGLFDNADQAELKDRYAQAIAASDDAHHDAQAL